MKIHERTLDRILAVISKGCSPDTIANILDDLVCADAIPSLSDSEVELAELIFDELAGRNPEAVEKANSF